MISLCLYLSAQTDGHDDDDDDHDNDHVIL